MEAEQHFQLQGALSLPCRARAAEGLQAPAPGAAGLFPIPAPEPLSLGGLQDALIAVLQFFYS